jgi:hypothetical protein
VDFAYGRRIVAAADAKWAAEETVAVAGEAFVVALISDRRHSTRRVVI